jgi:hypothetical protein
VRIPPPGYRRIGNNGDGEEVAGWPGAWPWRGYAGGHAGGERRGGKSTMGCRSQPLVSPLWLRSRSEAVLAMCLAYLQRGLPSPEYGATYHAKSTGATSACLGELWRRWSAWPEHSGGWVGVWEGVGWSAWRCRFIFSIFFILCAYFSFLSE